MPDKAEDKDKPIQHAVFGDSIQITCIPQGTLKSSQFFPEKSPWNEACVSDTQQRGWLQVFIFRSADIFPVKDLVSPATEPPRIFRQAVLVWISDVASQNYGIQDALGRPFFAHNIETAFTCALISAGTELNFCIADDLVPCLHF